MKSDKLIKQQIELSIRPCINVGDIKKYKHFLDLPESELVYLKNSSNWFCCLLTQNKVELTSSELESFFKSISKLNDDELFFRIYEKSKPKLDPEIVKVIEHIKFNKKVDLDPEYWLSDADRFLALVEYTSYFTYSSMVRKVCFNEIGRSTPVIEVYASMVSFGIPIYKIHDLLGLLQNNPDIPINSHIIKALETKNLLKPPVDKFLMLKNKGTVQLFRRIKNLTAEEAIQICEHMLNLGESPFAAFDTLQVMLYNNRRSTKKNLEKIIKYFIEFASKYRVALALREWFINLLGPSTSTSFVVELLRKVENAKVREDKLLEALLKSTFTLANLPYKVLRRFVAHVDANQSIEINSNEELHRFFSNLDIFFDDLFDMLISKLEKLKISNALVDAAFLTRHGIYFDRLIKLLKCAHHYRNLGFTKLSFESYLKKVISEVSLLIFEMNRHSTAKNMLSLFKCIDLARRFGFDANKLVADALLLYTTSYELTMLSSEAFANALCDLIKEKKVIIADSALERIFNDKLEYINKIKNEIISAVLSSTKEKTTCKMI